GSVGNALASPPALVGRGGAAGPAKPAAGGKGGGEGSRGLWEASPRPSMTQAGSIDPPRGRSVDRGVGDRRPCLLTAAPRAPPVAQRRGTSARGHTARIRAPTRRGTAVTAGGTACAG